MSETKHTPTPWKADPADYDCYVWGPNNEMVLQLRGTSANLPKRANAEFIVRSCNSHDALLSVARSVAGCLPLAGITPLKDSMNPLEDLLARAKEAVAKALAEEEELRKTAELRKAR